MLRKSRIDAPGALHHIICRGIERRKIFYDEDIWKPGNQPLRVRARSLVCFWAVTESGMSGTSVGKLLRLIPPDREIVDIRENKIDEILKAIEKGQLRELIYDRRRRNQ